MVSSAANPFVLNVSTQALARACADVGLDVTSQLERVGVSPGALWAPSGRVRAGSAHALWSWAHESAARPDLSLRVASSVAFGSYQLVDFLVSSSPRLGTALQVLAQSLPTINPMIRASVYEEGGLLHFEIAGLEHASYIEFVLAVCYEHTAQAFGRALPLVRVEVALPEPSSREPHERLFGCPVHFEAERTRMTLAAELGGWRHAHSSAALHAHLLAHLRQTLAAASAPRDASCVLREVLVEGMSEGREVGIEEASRRMGVSVRTLQRRLGREHRTFRGVLDDARQERAYELLADPERSLVEVGLSLGFSGQSAFQRAFRRWTGTTPRAWRHEGA